MAVAGLLLAAGASRRLGEPKQLLTDAAGVPRVRAAAQQLLDAGCAPVLVVIGATAARVRAALAGLPVQCVEHAHFAEGMGSSIAAGVRALAASADEEGASHAVLIAACDMPGISTAHLATLLTASADRTSRVASAYPSAADSAGVADLVRGIPAVFPRTDWPALEALRGDRGARDLLRDHDTLTVFVPAGRFDLDTPADVLAWRERGE
jgi:molybdenum cofactor cytidylyltransferase